jgi:hypothetical protein
VEVFHDSVNPELETRNEQEETRGLNWMGEVWRMLVLGVASARVRGPILSSQCRLPSKGSVVELYAGSLFCNGANR